MKSWNLESIGVVHLNNDDHLDIIVVNCGRNPIWIYLSNANGTYEDQERIWTGSESDPWSVILCQINDDQYFHIVVANYINNNLVILLANGNGIFNNEMIVSIDSSRPLFVYFTHLNNDNHRDLALVNNGTNSIIILHGFGNGWFDQ